MERIQLIDDATGTITRGLPLSTLATQADLAAVGSGNVPDESLTNIKISPTAAIEESKLALNHSTNDLAARVPAGAVFTFAGSSLPDGFVLCNGGLLSRTIYASLFAAIGTTYNVGGEATDVFRLPDLRGKFVRGLGGSSGALGATQANTTAKPASLSISTSVTINNTGTLSKLSGGETANHQHVEGVASTRSDAEYGSVWNGSVIWGSDNASAAAYQPYTNIQTSTHQHYTDISHTHTGSASTSTSGWDTETRPVNMAMNYIIKY